MVTGIDVHVYNVKDFERALTFYTGLLGKPTTTMGGGWAEFDLADGSSLRSASMKISHGSRATR
jgi:catechol 2,3-dioxygenase-like lactoylglutathione lyase family enzyme